MLGLNKISKILDRNWRILATGFSFVVFGLQGLLLVPLIPFVRMAGDRETAEFRFQKITALTFTFFLHVMRTVGVIKPVKYKRWDHVSDVDPAIYVANHPTLIDVIAVISRFDRMDCVVKEGVWNNPCMALPVRTAGYVPNRNSVQVFEECLERLERGRSVFLFPEGTRSPEDGLGEFSRLPAQLSHASGCDLIPLTIEYNHSTLRSDQSWYEVPPEPLALTVTVQEAISPDGTEGSLKKRSEETTAKLRNLYERELSFMSGSNSSMDQGDKL